MDNYEESQLYERHLVNCLYAFVYIDQGLRFIVFNGGRCSSCSDSEEYVTIVLSYSIMILLYGDVHIQCTCTLER